MHLWCQYGSIEKCYQDIDSDIIKNKIDNFKRWVEIPDDCLGARLDHKLSNFIDYNRIVVEFLCIDENQPRNSQDDVSSLTQTPLYWPLAKPIISSSGDFVDIQVGDIVDILVKNKRKY